MDRSRKLEKVAAEIGRRVGHGFWKREGRLGALRVVMALLLSGCAAGAARGLRVPVPYRADGGAG